MIDASINNLPLSNRAKNALWKQGYRTFGELLDATDNELLRCVGLGKHSLAEVKQMLELYRSVETETRKAMQDSLSYGAGMTIDGKHVPVEEWRND